MDVVKVFVEDPAALGGGSPLGAGNGGTPAPPDASAEAFLERLRAPSSPFARAYVAGTVLAGSTPVRVGLTSIDTPAAFSAPLMAWAAGRTWTRLTAGGRATGILDREAREALESPAGTHLLALGPGPIPADILATIVLGDAHAVRPRPPHPSPRRRPARGRSRRCPPTTATTGRSSRAARFARASWTRSHACPAPGSVRRFVLPRVRSESKFYVEQWALDALPSGTAEV